MKEFLVGASLEDWGRYSWGIAFTLALVRFYMDIT